MQVNAYLTFPPQQDSVQPTSDDAENDNKSLQREFIEGIPAEQCMVSRTHTPKTLRSQ